jgi:hypothetical protein
MHFRKLGALVNMNHESFHPAIDELAVLVLLGSADDSQRAELNHLLTISPENRRRFLNHTALHGLLICESRSGLLSEDRLILKRRSKIFFELASKRLVEYWLPTAAFLIVFCLAAITLVPPKAAAALDRVILAMNTSGDRAYQIRVLEQQSDLAVTLEEAGRFPPSKYLDGATLWLRGEGEFVFQQMLPNGQTRTIGSDGKEGWSLRSNGPVHVSPEPMRFGRAIFARNGEFAFLDLRSQLEELKRLYRMEWIDQKSYGLWKIRGIRRSQNQGGSREIELWFDPETNLVDRMILRGLPRASGGPQSIEIQLCSTDPMPPNFFKHAAHHDHNRLILTEP